MPEAGPQHSAAARRWRDGRGSAFGSGGLFAIVPPVDRLITGRSVRSQAQTRPNGPHSARPAHLVSTCDVTAARGPLQHNELAQLETHLRRRRVETRPRQTSLVTFARGVSRIGVSEDLGDGLGSDVTTT